MPRHTMVRQRVVRTSLPVAWGDVPADGTMGTITAVMPERGFGFIRPEDGDGPDIFFHASCLRSSLHIADLNPGDVVAFEVEPAPYGRGRRAVGVHCSSGEQVHASRYPAAPT